MYKSGAVAGEWKLQGIQKTGGRKKNKLMLKYLKITQDFFMRRKSETRKMGSSMSSPSYHDKSLIGKQLCREAGGFK